MTSKAAIFLAVDIVRIGLLYAADSEIAYLRNGRHLPGVTIRMAWPIGE